jgi:hypothetical protein
METPKKKYWGEVIKYYQPQPAEVPVYGWCEQVSVKKPEPPIPYFHTDKSVCKHCKTGLECMRCEWCSKCCEKVETSLKGIQTATLNFEKLCMEYAWPIGMCAHHVAKESDRLYFGEFRTCRICAYLLRMTALKWNI